MIKQDIIEKIIALKLKKDIDFVFKEETELSLIINYIYNPLFKSDKILNILYEKYNYDIDNFKKAISLINENKKIKSYISKLLDINNFKNNILDSTYFLNDNYMIIESDTPILFTFIKKINNETVEVFIGKDSKATELQYKNTLEYDNIYFGYIELNNINILFNIDYNEFYNKPIIELTINTINKFKDSNLKINYKIISSYDDIPLDKKYVYLFAIFNTLFDSNKYSIIKE